jgi:hypothetical protein
MSAQARQRAPLSVAFLNERQDSFGFDSEEAWRRAIADDAMRDIVGWAWYGGDVRRV